MLGLVLRAIGRRRVQAALLFLLAAAAATGAAAAPGYVAASTQSLAVAAISYAPPSERVVAVNRRVILGPDPGGAIESAVRTVSDRLVLTGFESVDDTRITGRIGREPAVLAARGGACEQVILEGTCPTGAREVALSAQFATRLDLSTGDSIPFGIDGVDDAVPLRVVGIFRARAPFDPYWGRSAGTTQELVAGERLVENMLLTPRETFSTLGAESVSVGVDLIATPESFRHTDPQLLALAQEEGARRLVPDGYSVVTGLRDIADRIWLDQRLVLLAVSTGAVQLMVLCWFALFQAIRQTAEERQPDVAKLKLHGVRRRDVWALVAGQITLPLLGGGVAGYLIGTWLSGALSDVTLSAAIERQVRLGALAATGLAVAGAVVAALLAERRLIRGSVLDLGRRIPTRQGGLGAGIVEVAIFTGAIAAAYQIGVRTTGESRGLSLAAPLLLALAAALLAARLVPLLARASAGGLLRSGRVGAWLVAVNLARRPGQFRVLALLSLAVAVFCTATFSWGVSNQARANRVAFEAGADRVVTVQTTSRAALLAAVRGVDPQGRFAMAAVQTFDSLPTLAVDVDRLGSVTPWQSGYGAPSWADLIASLRPPSPPPSVASAERLRLDVTWRSEPSSVGGEFSRGKERSAGGLATNPVRVVVGFGKRDGTVVRAEFGPLLPGRHVYDAALAGCTPQIPCRLAFVTVVPSPGAIAVGAGNSVVLHRLSQLGSEAEAGSDVVSTAGFADRSRWRNDITPGAHVPLLSTEDGGLVITDVAPGEGSPLKPLAPVYPLDGPMPLPVVAVGDPKLSGDVGDPRLALLGSGLTPIRVVSQARVMPRLGTGVLVDLEYADRALPATRSVGLFQVWLGTAAPPDVLERLAAAGLVVVAVDAAADRAAQLAAQGPPVAVWFLLLISAAGVLLALGSFAVWTAAERTGRASELGALRRQGLSRRSARITALGGYLVFVVASVTVGVAMSLALLRFQTLPVFADEWSALATPAPDVRFAVAAVAPSVGLLLLGAIVAGVALLRASGHPREVA